MKLIKVFGLMVTLLVLVACVTINIYFPAAQAEAAAERIVDDILGGQVPEDKVPGSDKGAGLQRGDHRQIAMGILEFLIPAANAAQPNFTVDTPQIRKLQAGMKARNTRLAGYYSSGAIGFTRDALVAVRDPAVVPLKDRNLVNKLVADENRDRNALYKAIAAANGHPEWEGDVRATFAKTWVDKAGKGWWYQDPKGRWSRR
ncbi:MAG: YdbL family protein [Gammaproteobacteria bacterium]|nr:YdbL family protein [Gammaproteobacteria bacterium]